MLFEQSGGDLPPASSVRKMVQVAKAYLAGDLTILDVYYAAHAAHADVKMCDCSTALKALCHEWVQVVEDARGEWGGPIISEEEFRDWLLRQL